MLRAILLLLRELTADEACRRNIKEVLLEGERYWLPRTLIVFVVIPHTMKDDCVRVLTCFSEIHVNP